MERVLEEIKSTIVAVSADLAVARVAPTQSQVDWQRRRLQQLQAQIEGRLSDLLMEQLNATEQARIEAAQAETEAYFNVAEERLRTIEEKSRQYHEIEADNTIEGHGCALADALAIVISIAIVIALARRGPEDGPSNERVFEPTF